MDDEAAMWEWLASRKNLPAGTRQLLGNRIEFSALGETSGEHGAAAALRRMESAERSAFEDYKKALAGGSPYAIKHTQDRWTKLTEALRKYDLLVEQSRRDAGELMPRSEVERVLRALAWYLRIAGQRVCVGLTKTVTPMTDYAGVNDVLTRGLWDELLASFAGLAAKSEGAVTVPEWAINALSSDLEHVLEDVGPAVKRRAEVIEKLMK